MQHATFFPVVTDSLLPYIDSFSYVSFDSNDSLLVPPLGFPVILFCFSPHNSFYTHNEFKNESVVVGQMTRYIKINPSPNTKLFGINFKPYGFYNLFQVSLAAYQDGGFGLNQLFSEQDIVTIYDQLANDAPIHDVIASVEQIILKYQHPVSTPSFFDPLVDRMVKSNGIIHPYHLLSCRSLTKSFQRYFTKTIGISPKKFCSIYRHKFILKLKYDTVNLSWNDIVFDGSYYDYSHFYRDFKKFTTQHPFSFPFDNQDFVRKLI